MDTVKVVCGVCGIRPLTIVERGGSVEFFFSFMIEYIEIANACLLFIKSMKSTYT